jgi:predicted DNA-binding protein
MVIDLDLKLPPEIDAALTRAARRARKPKATLLRRAVEAYLEELTDARAVQAARSQGGKAIPWAEVKRRHGLAG